MPTLQDVDSIVHRVEALLRSTELQTIPLKVSGSKLDDGWLYIVVQPSQIGVRAADHARVMSQIERQLRGEGMDNVLLIPALED